MAVDYHLRPVGDPSYDARTALAVVDVQNDFAHPDGGLYVRGGENLVSTINAQIAKAGEAGAVVVYTQDWHPASTPHFAKDGGIWPVHCVMDTWGAELHPQLLVTGPVVRKGSSGEDGYSGFSARSRRWSGYAPTQLQSLLDPSVRRLIVVGLAG